MAKDPAERYASTGDLVRETNESFSRRIGAAVNPPGPIEKPLDTGVRGTEAGASTREARPPETEPGHTVRADAAGETVPGRTERESSGPPRVRRGRADGGRPCRAAAGGSAPARRAGGLVLITSAGAVLLVVVAVGFLVGRSSSGPEESTPSADNTATAGALELSFPDTWQRASDPPAVPGLKLRDPIALSERGRPRRDALTAGTTDATGPALLPQELLRRLAGPPKRDDAVKLGALDAYRYEGLRPTGFNGRLTLYVAPTTEGVATVACASTAGDAAAFLPDCETVAGGLKLVLGKAFALGADQSYLAKLDKAIGHLNADRKRNAAKLRKAKTQADQANAARSLAKDYRRARRSFTAARPSARRCSTRVSRCARRSRELQLAYSRLAARARDGSQAEYNAARDDVSAGEAALKRALAQVDKAS